MPFPVPRLSKIHYSLLHLSVSVWKCLCAMCCSEARRTCLTHSCPSSLVTHHSLPSVLLLLILALFIFPSLLSSPLSPSDPSLHPSSSPCSFPEQPVDHPLPVSRLLPHQQLCVQLPAAMAPQPNHQLRKRRVPPMVRHAHTPVQRTCLFVHYIKNNYRVRSNLH